MSNLKASTTTSTKPLPAGAGVPGALRFLLLQAGVAVLPAQDVQGNTASFPLPVDGLYEITSQRVDVNGTPIGDDSTTGEFLISGGQIVSTFQAPGAVTVSIEADPVPVSDPAAVPA